MQWFVTQMSCIVYLVFIKIGMKCFNCPPKYLCFDTSGCQFVNVDDDEMKQKSN